MATRKPKAQKKSSGAKAKKAAPKKQAPKAKRPAARAKAKSAPKTPAASPAKHPLAAALAAHLHITEDAAIERALEDLAMQVGLHGDQAGAPAHREPPGPAVKLAPEPRTASASIAPGGYLPRRLYLSLDGRGLDGGGMPVEVIDVPCTIGSGRRNTIWVNSPQVETQHAQILQTDDGWIFEDLGSEHGTFLNDKKITREVIHDGDTFLLANYLRVKASLR